MKTEVFMEPYLSPDIKETIFSVARQILQTSGQLEDYTEESEW